MALKTYKLDTSIEEEAKSLKMNTNQYVKYLQNLAVNNQSKIAELNNQKLTTLEGIVQSLVQQNISRRATELTLEKELRKMYEQNKELHELVLANFEFINVLKKEFA